MCHQDIFEGVQTLYVIRRDRPAVATILSRQRCAKGSFYYDIEYSCAELGVGKEWQLVPSQLLSWQVQLCKPRSSIEQAPVQVQSLGLLEFEAEVKSL